MSPMRIAVALFEGVTALDAVGLRSTRTIQRLLDRIDDGTNLAVVAPGGDDEPIGDPQNRSDIESVGSLTQLVLGGGGGHPDPGDQLLVFGGGLGGDLVG